MSTSAEQIVHVPGNRFVEFDEFIDYQVGRARQGIRSTDLLTGVVGLALGVAGYLLLFILCDHWVIPGGFGMWGRLLIWLVGLSGLTAWVLVRLVRPFRQRVNVLFAARQIERTQPDLKSSLLTLIDLKQAGREAPPIIRSALEKRAAVSLSRTDLDQAVDRHVLMFCSYSLLGVLTVFCAYALLSPKSIAQSAWRAIVPFSNVSAVTRTRIDRIAPGNIEVPAMSKLDLEVEISGQVPGEVLALCTTGDRRFVDEPVALRDTGEGLRRFRGTLLGEDGRGLRQNLTYHIVAGDAVSSDFLVRVVPPPSGVVQDVTYSYPGYMGLAEKTDSGGAIDAWEGTRVTVRATANMPVSSGSILFSDSEETSLKAEEVPLNIQDGTQLSATWQLAFRSDGSYPKFYRVQVRNEAGHGDPQPALHPLRIRPDLPPKLELISPQSDIKAPANGSVGVAYRAADPDFQLHSVVMHFEQQGQELSSRPQLFQGPPDRTGTEGVYTIRLKDLGLAAGSRLTWWLEAQDNFEPFGQRGNNRTVTAKLNIDLLEPESPEAAKEHAQQAEAQAQQALDQAADSQTGGSGAEQPDDDRQPPETGSDTHEDQAGLSDKQNSESQAAQDASEQGAHSGEETASATDATQQTASDSNSSDPAARSAEGSSSATATDKPQGGDPQSTDAGNGPEDQSEHAGSRPAATSPATDRSHPTTGKNSARNSAPSSDSQSKTPDDVALERLLDWDRRQRTAAAKAQPQNPGHDSTRPNADRNQQPPADSQAADQTHQPPEGAATIPESSGSTKSDRNEGSRPASPPKGASQATDPASQAGSPTAPPTPSQQSPPDGVSPENHTPDSNSRSTKPANSDATSSTNPAASKPSTDTPISGDRESPASGQNSAEPSRDAADQDRSHQDSSDEGTSAGNQSAASEPADPGSPQGTTDSPPATDDTSGTPGPDQSPSPSAASENPEPTPGDNAANSPAPKDRAPGQSTDNQQTGTPKDGGSQKSSAGSKTQGSSDNRRQQSSETSRSTENRSPGSEQPLGRPDEGARSNGDGNSGSSTPGTTGDQTASGPGENSQNSHSETGTPGSQTSPKSKSTSASAGQPKPGDSAAGGSPSSNGSPSSSGQESSAGAKSGSEANSSSSPGGSPSNASSATTGESQSGASGSDGGQPPGGSASQDATDQSDTGEAENQSTPPDGSTDPRNPENRAHDEARRDPGGASTDQGSGGGSQSDSAQPAARQSNDKPQESPAGQSADSATPSGSADSSKGSSGQDSTSSKGQDGGGGGANSGGETQSGSSPGSPSGSGTSQSSGSTRGAQSVGGAPTAAGANTQSLSGAAAGDGDAVPARSTPADLDNKKKATNLALKRLQDTLERGETDSRLQQELGFTDEQLAEFMERLEQRLADTGEDQSPEAQARRRQFESLLESLQFDAQGDLRNGGDGGGPTGAGFSAPRRPAPAEYRAAESQYRQRISNQRKTP